jgi:hypothetical protein
MTVTAAQRHGSTGSFFTFSTQTTFREFFFGQSVEFYDAPRWFDVRLTKAVRACRHRLSSSDSPTFTPSHTLPIGTHFPHLTLIRLDADTQVWVGDIGSHGYLMYKCDCCDGVADELRVVSA